MTIDLMKRVVAAFDAPDGMPEFCKAIDDMRQAIERAEQQAHIIDCPRCGHCCPGTAEQEPICAHGVSKIKCDFCKQAEQPVEWLTGCPECGMDGECNCKPEQAQPVAWATKEDFYRELDRAIGRVRKQMEVKAVTMRCKDYDLALPIIDMHFGHVLVGQVTAPPQRQPLTDEELGAMLGTGINGKVFKQIARAIEAAHGIKEDKK